MITLKKEGVTMEVATEFEASVFLRSGYKRVGNDQPTATVEAVVAEEAQAEPEAGEKVTAEPEKPKRRRRTAKQAG